MKNFCFGLCLIFGNDFKVLGGDSTVLRGSEEDGVSH